MWSAVSGSILSIVDKIVNSSVLSIIDKIIPDPEQRDKAKLEFLKQEQSGDIERIKQEQSGEIEKINAQLSAIIAEAKSGDKLTSRARPTFLYVMYIFILSAIPMGFLSAFLPEIANAVSLGAKNWLLAIPEELFWLFGAGYLGYTGARTVDKIKR